MDNPCKEIPMPTMKPEMSYYEAMSKQMFRELEPEERMRVIRYLKQFYCFHCGDEEPGGARGCQCWNDE